MRTTTTRSQRMTTGDWMGDRLWRLAVVCLISVAMFASPRGHAAPPNILLILADDQAWNASGVYGHPDVRTPNIDRLAGQGMRFTHAFTATAMCAPTRQQLYTGLFPVRNGAYPNHSRVKPGTKSLVHFLRDLGYRVGLSGKRHFGPRASFPFEQVKADQLKAFMTRDAKQPFCLVICSDSPHLPWTAGDASAYDPGKLTLPPDLVDTPATRQALTRYYAEITDFDREVGQAMALIDASGRAANTLFIYTSEQGGQFPRGKWTCYDAGLRTAMVIRWPDRVQAGAVTDAMVQYVDVLPTLLAAAGVATDKMPADFDGASFMPVLLGQRQTHHDAVFGVHTTRGIIQGSACYPIRSIRTRNYKYIRNLNHQESFHNILIAGVDRGGYWTSWVEKARTNAKARRLVEGYQHRPAEELYDLVNDPYELTNLADDSNLAAVKADLRRRLTQWMQQQGDEGVATELAVKPHRTGRR